jgi:hypothetical protein
MLSTNHVLAHIHMMRIMTMMKSKPTPSIHMRVASINAGDESETMNAL